ncbi:MAG TPA: alpha/beta fold hydrolase [Chitinispirillaceae bacterium]|jgi:pimeloyl-ACP methyl ester carboxylesterase|nr:alpha/beta fold hydrolase [Chitinispirillaceae bacterium]
MEDSYENGDEIEPATILEVIRGGISAEGYEEVILVTPRGEIKTRFYSLAETKIASIMVGGAGGDFDTPARGLYHRLGADLLDEGFSSLRIQFRNSHNFDDSVYDVAAGIAFLRSLSIDSIGLIGHSFGGAVVIRAASMHTSVSAVVALSSQSYGAGSASELGPRCALFLIHGSEDTIIPPSSSEHILSLAKEPRRLKIYRGSHSLDEVSQEVYEDVKDWIIRWVRDLQS